MRVPIRRAWRAILRPGPFYLGEMTVKLGTVRNLATNASKPGMLIEMIRKVAIRLNERGEDRLGDEATAFAQAEAVDPDRWARTIDAPLWDEALAFAEAQAAYAGARLSALPVSLGGGGFDALLYFLTRLTRAQTIVETGVAAGFSSRAFLSAIDRNGRGRLFSSDFPYFRIENPEAYIGILVEPALRDRWTLHIEGDRANLPRIAAQAGPVDIFHYDSDKSRTGRNFALDTLRANITDRTIVIFDDIQNNLHFRDHVRNGARDWLVFASGGKYVGLIKPKAAGILP